MLDSDVVASLRLLDRAKIVEEIEAFNSDTIGHLCSLRRGVRSGDKALLVKKSNGLGTRSDNLGASTMAVLCLQLESAADNGDMARSSEILRQIETEFARVGPALSSIFP